MYQIAFALLATGLVVLIAEALWRNNILRGEYSRKLIHILLSILIAFLPFFVDWEEVWLYGAIALCGVLILRYTGIFKCMHDIRRYSLGDLLGPAAIMALALLKPPEVVFAAVVLYIGLADGLAAVIGTRFGRKNAYKVLGYKKSAAGTFTFYIVSLAITYAVLTSLSISSVSLVLGIVLIPFVLTIIENISVYGMDNLLILLVSSGILYMLGAF